jgi:hypothetical protein
MEREQDYWGMQSRMNEVEARNRIEGQKLNNE